jgi:hypothetical protein
MNSADYYNAMAYNEEIDAKRQARLDHIYEVERAKYSNPQVQTKIIEKVVEKPNSTYNSDVIARLDRLETRVDALAKLLTNMKPPEPKIGDLFVFATNNNDIYANNAITLSDEQFNQLIKTLREI